MSAAMMDNNTATDGAVMSAVMSAVMRDNNTGADDEMMMDKDNDEMMVTSNNEDEDSDNDYPVDVRKFKTIIGPDESHIINQTETKVSVFLDNN
jgi:hypothetical protein